MFQDSSEPGSPSVGLDKPLRARIASPDLRDGCEYPKDLAERLDQVLCPFMSKARTPSDLFVADVAWGTAYVDLLEAYVVFEQGALHHGSLSTLRRPPEVGHWINTARPTRLRANLNIDNHGQLLQGWWSTIQPDGRDKTSDDMPVYPPPANIDWSALDRGGSVGLVLVLVGIVIWRVAMERGRLPEDLTSWGNLVADVTETMHAVAASRDEAPPPTPVAPPSPPFTQPPPSQRKRRAGSSASKPPSKRGRK